ncbi:MAG: M48 family metallopeptidase [Betaproteobacteria bacterium]|nr:M48 family metallopeptidase [Betaproteobacteria bacterium]
MQTVSGFRRALLLGLIVLAPGCATNTITGRSQLMLVSEEAAVQGAVSAYANMMGQFSKKNKVETGTPRAARIKEITNRLVAEAVRFRPDSANWAWEVQLIDEPKTVNAFCMAGGKMGIYTGFWEKLNATDDEIGNVMGHEIGHALASHTREKMSMAMTVGVGTAVLAALVSSRNSNDPYAFQRNQNTAALAAAMAITLPNSRDAESEADQIGIELAARAGFDPRAAVTLWEKMAKEGGTSAEFLSTHPSPENRAERLRSLLVKVDPMYQLAKSRPATAAVPDFIDQPVNERAADGMTREEYAKKLAAEPQVMTFVAAEFEQFSKGNVVLTCATECVFGYSFHRSIWKELHAKHQWRDLAVAVMKVGYFNDLSYFLLGEAATGLGLKDAATTYYARARAAQQADKSCEGAFNTCEGFEIAKAVDAVLGVPELPPAPVKDKNYNKFN